MSPYSTLADPLTLRTKFVERKHRDAVIRFEKYLKRPRVTFLEDDPYREKALELCFSSSIEDYRPLSMVDCLIRLILDDDQVKIDYLAKFNEKDFVDICLKRKVEILR